MDRIKSILLPTGDYMYTITSHAEEIRKTGFSGVYVQVRRNMETFRDRLNSELKLLKQLDYLLDEVNGVAFNLGCVDWSEYDGAKLAIPSQQARYEIYRLIPDGMALLGRIDKIMEVPLRDSMTIELKEHVEEACDIVCAIIEWKKKFPEIVTSGNFYRQLMMFTDITPM